MIPRRPDELLNGGITFEEAVNVFDDPYAVFEQGRTDDETGELRWQAIGLVEGMVLLLVAHAVREEGPDESDSPHLGPPRHPEGAKPL
jgi:uncharacterized DUF497 family protein